MASAKKNMAARRRTSTPHGSAPQNDPAPIDNGIFSDNRNKVIDNPFAPAHMTPTQAMETGRKFAAWCGLSSNADLFEKAGLVLNDPVGCRRKLSLHEKAVLTSEACPDRDILRSIRQVFKANGWKNLRKDLFEQNGFWQQPKPLRATIMMLCNAAVVQGWCQAGTNGANLNWVHALLGSIKTLPDGKCDPHAHNAWIFAAVNASPYLSGAVVGSWLSDPLSETMLGRRAPIAISALAIVGGAIGSGFASTWQTLLICRITIGIGMGTKAAIVPVFAAEIAPANIRGSIVMNWQLFDAFGIFLGFTANLVAATVGQLAWRWQLASAALPAIVLLGQIYAAVESPRFLMKQGKYVAAYETLLTLRREPLLAAKELLYAYEQMRLETDLLSRVQASYDPERNNKTSMPERSTRNHFFRKVRLIFGVPRTRRALLAAMVVMIAQQLCGINVLIFYSSTVYGDFNNGCGNATSTDPHFRPLWLSWGIGLANFLFAIPAYWLIDSRGRRWLLVATLPIMALTMLATSMSYFIHITSEAYAPAIGLFTYIFVAVYSVGLGPVPFTYSAECFPLEVRMVGMSLAVFVNLLWAGILVLFVPVLTLDLKHRGLLGLFAGLNVLAFVLVYLFVPETGGAAIGNDPAQEYGNLTAISLEELNYTFGCRTREHVRYQYKVVFKEHFLRRFLLWNRDALPPIKFYTWPEQHERERERQDTIIQDEREDRIDEKTPDGDHIEEIGG